MAMTGEHPQDVLRRIAKWQSDGLACALIVITSTEGGAVRAPGALLAVNQQSSLGYISGGCIDADVILQSRQAIADNKRRSLRYGAGSPFVDLPLPCGGAIEVLIVPNPDPDLINLLCRKLEARMPAALSIDQDETLVATDSDAKTPHEANTFRYQPKLRLRIAGRGADALALAKISDAAGFEVQLQMLDEEDIEEALRADLKNVQKLQTASGLPALEDDVWTAFVLLFHDRDWEIPLLKQALAGPAFYIGAVGSRRTHANRCDELRAAACRELDIARIHGPIGLVPSLRDASAIALSTLAEIIQAAAVDRDRTTRLNTAFVLLAAGASRRYEKGDKLLANYQGRAVLEHAADIVADISPAQAIAVTAPGDVVRNSILKKAGWSIVENPTAQSGQASSLKCAMEHLKAMPEIDQIIILLADMPNIPARHIDQMIKLASDANVKTIMSESDQVLCPPALFKRDAFDALSGITGDRGAKSIFLDIEHGRRTLTLSPRQAIDIDCTDDLSRALENEHA